MMNNWHRYDLPARRQLLIEAGFARDENRIWAHADSRAVGESVVAALTDEAFARYLRIELPPPQARSEEGGAA